MVDRNIAQLFCMMPKSFAVNANSRDLSASRLIQYSRIDKLVKLQRVSGQLARKLRLLKNQWNNRLFVRQTKQFIQSTTA